MHEININECIPLSENFMVNKDKFITLEDYICLICRGVVINPKMCGKCEQSFCDFCITKFLNMNQYENCPHCYNEPFETINLQRAIKNTLNSMRFKCQYECGEEVFNYDKLKNHLNSCENFEKSYVCK